MYNCMKLTVGTNYQKISRTVSSLFFATLFSLLWSCSHGDETNKSAVTTIKNDHLKLLILGIDGMVPDFATKYMSSGKMPNLARIAKNGSVAIINAQGKLNSPVIWTTIATSSLPEVHGITGFTINNTPVNSSFRKVPALWNMLDANHVKSATLGWWATWPAEKDGSIMISDLAFWGDSAEKVFPEDIIDTEKYKINNYFTDLSFLPRFTKYIYAPDYKDKFKEKEWQYRLNRLIEERLVNVYYRDKIFTEIAVELLEKEKPQVLNLYLRGVDYVQHAFWQFMEPEPFRKAGWSIDKEEAKLLQNIIPEYYNYIDELVGKLLPYCDASTFVFVISDHGFMANPQLKTEKPGLDLSGDHNPKTLLVMSGPGILKQKQQDAEVNHVDFVPTVLYTLGLPLAKNFIGHPAQKYFTHEFQKNNRITLIDTYKKTAKAKGQTTSKQDADIIKNLRSLGYIK